MINEIKQNKYDLVIEDSNYKLIRLEDGLIKQSNDVRWILFCLNFTTITFTGNPEIGRSLLMSPFNECFTWCTTEVTELIEVRENYTKFKTKNSTYELYKL